jgi:hypothetical protein
MDADQCILVPFSSLSASRASVLTCGAGSKRPRASSVPSNRPSVAPKGGKQTSSPGNNLGNREHDRGQAQIPPWTPGARGNQQSYARLWPAKRREPLRASAVSAWAYECAMSFHAMAWAVKQKVGNATGKAILIMLANYANDRGECFPSQERLAADCECSVATIARWLGLFVEMGLLTRQKRYGDGGYRRSDLLRVATNSPIKTLPNSALPNCAPKLTQQNAGAEPINEPTSLRSVSADAKDEVEFRAALAPMLDTETVDTLVLSRRKKKVAVNGTAGHLLVRALRCCPDIRAAADEMALRGWTTVKPEWLKDEGRGSPASRPMSAAQLAMSRAKKDFQNDDFEPKRNDRVAPHLIPQLPERRR